MGDTFPFVYKKKKEISKVTNRRGAFMCAQPGLLAHIHARLGVVSAP